jgi:hypothetical protein
MSHDAVSAEETHTIRTQIVPFLGALKPDETFPLSAYAERGPGGEGQGVRAKG